MKSLKDDLFVSVDIEANGPIPGQNSMLQLGAAAFQFPSRKPVDTFSINLGPLRGAEEDAETMAWWGKQDPAVWADVTRDPVPAPEAMASFLAWTEQLRHFVGKSPVLVTYPVWDYMWVHWYFMRFCGKNPYGLASLDIKSLAAGVLQTEFKGTAKPHFPKAWFHQAPPHTHRGLDDAIGQGVLLMNLLEDLFGR